MKLPYSAGHSRRLASTVLTLLIIATGFSSVGCAAKAPKQIKSVTISEEGLNLVRIEPNPDAALNTHPVTLTPSEVATILRGVRSWERRNVIHRLAMGDAPKTRAFRDEEISFLAPALSRALGQAGPSDRVYFHLSRATASGEEETTTGWVLIREPLLYLIASEVHDLHGPGPDISRYDRQMPNVPAVSGTFDLTFEPEQYLAKVVSGGGWFSADQREELRILYREALPVLPLHPIEEKAKQPQPAQ